MSKHKVSRGNTSDLIGLWNNRASNVEAAKPVPSLLVVPSSANKSIGGSSLKFRKSSAFVPAVTITESVNRDEPKFRKTSAMVLMPVHQDRSKSPNRHLNIDMTSNSSSSSEFKPMKNLSGLNNGTQDLPKLRSALKLSTTVPPPTIQMDNLGITTESSSKSSKKESKNNNNLDSNNNDRRGSIGLGRSKSVCHRVKFVPNPPQQNEEFGRRNVNFAKFQQMDDTTAENHSRLTRQASLPSLNDKKSGAGTPPVSAHSPNSNTNNGLQRSFGGGGGSSGRSSVVARSPSSAKEVILTWIQERTKNYSNINVTNFSSSWSDGLAFCALIHYYYPEAFDYDKLEAKNRRYNFELAFKTAEDYADICPLLDVEDMVLMLKPDWKCVFTYVQSFYRRFRHGREPPIPTKTLTLTPHTAPHSSTTIKSIE